MRRKKKFKIIKTYLLVGTLNLIRFFIKHLKSFAHKIYGNIDWKYYKKDQFKISITNLKIIQGLITNNLKITDPKKIQQISRSIDKKSRLGLKSVKDFFHHKFFSSQLSTRLVLP